MDYSKPTLFVISGPPGVGKSTFGKELVPEELRGIEPYNRDTLLIDIFDRVLKKNKNLERAQKIATNTMELKLSMDMGEAIKNRQHFALETPLNHPKYLGYLATFGLQKYQIHLAYMCLDSTKDCEIRVQHRVKSGGHDVPPETIQNIYNNNLAFLNSLHLILDRIDLYDNTKMPKLLASFEKGLVIKADPEALNKTWIKEGLPQLSEKLKSHLQESHKTSPRHKL